MLRVTLIDNEAEQTLMVEGNLIAPCVAELESAWKEARLAARGRIVVDLTGTNFIDSSGQAALMAMIADGARLTAKGVYNEHLAQELTKRTREAGTSRSRQGGNLAMDSSLTKIPSHSARRSQNKGQRAR
jgi:ABC-type transporter Mla MlaB component